MYVNVHNNNIKGFTVQTLRNKDILRVLLQSLVLTP